MTDIILSFTAGFLTCLLIVLIAMRKQAEADGWLLRP